MTRPCKGCDGRGRREDCTVSPERWWDPIACRACVCPACLGTGTVTDGPFRRDAEVDAETLRRIYRTHYKVPKKGDPAFLPDRDMPVVVEWKPIAGSATITRAVASAAFRAVPGLREGE